MKIRQSLPIKITAFLLAVLCLAGAAALACLQGLEFETLWMERPTTASHRVHGLMREDRRHIYRMLELREEPRRNAYLEEQLQELEARFAAENTNLRWQLRDTGDELLAGNTEAPLPAAAYDGYWYWYNTDYGSSTQSSREVCLILWLEGAPTHEDSYRDAVLLTEQLRENRLPLLIAAAGAALAWLLLTICLCVWSGRRKGHDGISLCLFHRIPGDLLLAAYVFCGVALAFLAVEAPYTLWAEGPLWIQLTVAGLLGGGAAILLTSFLITLCARCKGRVVLRNMITVRVLVGFWQALKAAVESLPLIWKTALGVGTYLAISFLLWVATLNNAGAGWVMIWGVLSLLCALYLCWWSYHWKKIRRAAEDIIDGFTDCQIDTRRMPSDLRQHADELNSLNEAIAAAVDEKLRSEHFKSELITNVSHDLKTPLTSIISYVDLLKKEDISNPKALEYIEVLDRKSQRLKKLTEDLVEASKASTGNLAVEAERLDLIQLTDQALAEYHDRLEACGLSPVRALPDQPIWVKADGRHLWRVLDNLLSNCAKYALEGTRIYAEAERFFDCAELRIKNISREALNVAPDELMERFVRGDESRTTEGSGLGLSIARSLTELQEGQFFVSIDGDLFKVTLRLPLADAPE